MFDITAAKRLLIELRQGKCVVFAGAGIGIEADLPSWPQALGQMAEYIGDFDKTMKQAMIDRIAKNNFLGAAEVYYNADTEQERITRGIEIVFGKDPKINRNLKNFVNINFSQFITTNYDSTIEDAWALVNGKSLPILLNNEEGFLSAFRLMNQSKAYVLHLHGSIVSPKSIILARSHYEKIKELESYYMFLRHVLLTKSLIFVGFSFDDPALQALMEYTKGKLQLICERPSFSIISKEEKDKIRYLKESGVTTICYDSSNSHSGLWDLIDWLEAELKKPDGLPVVSIDTEDEEITKLKHNLASIYTHFKIRRNYQSIYESTVDGIVHLLGGSIEKTGHEATMNNIADEISKFFNIGKERATLIAQRSMGALVASNYAIPKPKKINTFSFVEVDTSIHTDLLTLVKSIRDRSKLRYSREIRFSDAQVCEFILLALVIDGVRIAHSIITSYPMPDTSTEDIFKKSYSIIFKESPAASEHFINAAWSLFTHPDRNEAEILGSISKVAFLADLSLYEPDLTSLNIKKPFHRVALDASILLPAICKYHPRYNIYRSVISKAQKKGIKVTVSEGFLEEIVTHRQLAKEIFSSEFYSNEQRFKNYVMFNGSDNINVFLGGFSGWSITEKSFDFQQYLKECAPYTDIDSLVNFLDRDRISRENPIKELSLETGKISLWHIALKDWYSEHKKTKANSLLWHEAIQLEALSISKTIGKPSAFLTADKGFIAAVSKIINERYLDQTVLHSIVMPIQFSYYIDLDEERNIDWKAYSKILWSKAFQEHHIKYSEYYIDKILQEYEPKLIDSLPKIINAINKEIEKAPSIDERSYQDEEIRFKEFKYIEDFDEKFYRIMNEEKDKLGLV